MKSPIDILLEKRIIISPDLDKGFNLNLTRDTHKGTVRDIIAAMEEYATQQLDKFKDDNYYELNGFSKDDI